METHKYEGPKESEKWNKKNICYNINNGAIKTVIVKTNEKNTNIIRDTSYTIVKKKFVAKMHLSDGNTTLKFENGDSKVIPTAEVFVEIQIYSGNTNLACFDTNFDAIIGNMPETKFMCTIET